MWDLLQDPVVLAKALPGTERLALTGAGSLRGRDEGERRTRDGGRFDVAVTLNDKLPPQQMSMQIDGKGPVGFTRGTAHVVLEEQPDSKTLMQ